MFRWSPFVRYGAIAAYGACGACSGPSTGAGIGNGGVTGQLGGSGATSSGGRSSTASGGAYAMSGSGESGSIDVPPPLHVDSGTGAGGTDGGCAGITVAGETLPLDILILFDRSKSMLCEIPAGGDRWTATKTALTSFLQNPGASGINVGLTYFGTTAPGGDPLGSSSCNPYDYETPDVEFTALPSGATAIVNSLAAHTAQTDTPTVAALTGAINHAASWKADHAGDTVIVVLVTDGQPNACGAGNLSEVVDVATKGLSKGMVQTYMVGILSPGSTCTLDPNQPNQADLDSVAKAGGTTAALVVDTTKDTGTQLLDTMNKIRQNAQIPCEYTIPKPDGGGTLDYDKVNVSYLDPMAAKQDVYYVEKASACDPTKGGGWYYDNAPPTPAPTKILLCPSTCSTVTGKFGYRVNVTLGCQALRIPA
jgi:hypothetical protein